jgi:hypothetical protein
MVILEADLVKQGKRKDCAFATLMKNMLVRNLEDCLKSRAVFILVAYAENDATKSILEKELKQNMKMI